MAEQTMRAITPADLGGRGFLTRLYQGFAYPFRGVRYLFSHPRLFHYSLIPFVLNTVLYAFFLYASYHWLFDPFQQAVMAWLPAWEILRKVLWYVLLLLAAVLFLIFAAVSFAIAGNILASPFHDLLSERVEQMLSGTRVPTPPTWGAMIRMFGRGIKEELKKLSFFLVVQVAILLIWIIPVAGAVLHPFLATLATIWFVAVEFIDYPMARRGLLFRQRMGAFWRWKYQVLGFGAGAALFLLVPLAGLLTLPASVIGGTMLFLEEGGQTLLPP